MARNTTYYFYRIGAIDPDYKHIWGFQSPAERENFLSSKLQKVIYNNAYWRPVDQTLKVNFTEGSIPSFEKSYTYDYVKVVNRDGAAEQVYYLFIVGRSYINYNLTEITVAIDYIQTYYFSGNTPFWNTSGYCLYTTDRGYLPPRGIGAEYPALSYETVWKNEQSTAGNIGFIVFSTIDISATGNEQDDWILDYNNPFTDGGVEWGGVIQQNFMAAYPYIINNGTSVDNSAVLYHLNEDLNAAGQLGSITGIYACPTSLLPVKTADNAIMRTDNDNSFPTVTVTVPLANTILTGSYNTGNPIISGYDYTKITVSNQVGEEIEYHYEDFAGQPRFKIQLSIAAGYPVQICYPDTNFKYGSQNLRQMFAMKQTSPPQTSMQSDNFAIWQAQNRNSIQASLDASNLTIENAKEVRSKTGGIATALDNLFDKASEGASDMLSSLGLQLPESASDALTTAGYSGLNSLLSMGFLSSFGLEASYVYDQQVNVAMQGLKNVEASFKDQRYLPTTVHGSNCFGDLLLINQFGFLFFVTTPSVYDGGMINKDLEANGHICKQVATVERSRYNFDYWRVIDLALVNDASIRPYFVNQMMIKLFSDGIYLWWFRDGNINTSRFAHPYNLTNNPI